TSSATRRTRTLCRPISGPSFNYSPHRPSRTLNSAATSRSNARNEPRSSRRRRGSASFPDGSRNLLDDAVGVTQYVVGGEAEDNPACLPQCIGAGDVASKLGSLTVVVALVLQGDTPLWIGQVDPGDETAALVAYLVLRYQRGRARV